MWKSIKAILEIIETLPCDDCIKPQAMPQTHYLSGDFADEFSRLLPRQGQAPIKNEADTLILTIQPLQDLR
jgi:hypothetical protein